MNYYRFPENRITKVLLGLYLFVMLYLCRDTMFCLYVVGFYPSQVITLGLTGLLGLVFLWYQRRNLKQVVQDGRMVLVLVATALILLPMLDKQDWQLMYFSILAFLYISIFLSYFVSWQTLAKYYVLMLTALAVYSILAAYLFRIPIDMGLIQKDVFRDGRDVGIYNFLFSIVPRTFEKRRNFGMFREPGVYQYFILLGLYLTHYGVQWKKDWSKWTVTALLCVTMVTTMATGGLAEMCLLAAFVFFEKKLYKNRVVLSLAIVMILLVLGVLYYSYDNHGELWNQFYLMTFNKFSAQEDSVTERTEAIFVNLEMIKASPFVGVPLSQVLHAVENNTSSTLVLLAGMGLISGSLHILAWAALVWRKERHVLANLALMIILFLSFNTQNLSWNLFFWLFPMMALTEKTVPVIEKRLRKGSV